jgi:hypothetical protein
LIRGKKRWAISIDIRAIDRWESEIGTVVEAWRIGRPGIVGVGIEAIGGVFGGDRGDCGEVAVFTGIQRWCDETKGRSDPVLSVRSTYVE